MRRPTARSRGFSFLALVFAYCLGCCIGSVPPVERPEVANIRGNLKVIHTQVAELTDLSDREREIFIDILERKDQAVVDLILTDGTLTQEQRERLLKVVDIGKSAYEDPLFPEP